MILDHPALAGRVFFPRPTDVEPDLWVDVPGAKLGCHIDAPHPGAGWVLYFHGNGEIALDHAEHGTGELFTSAGANACFVEYRGYGRSTGAPGLSAMRGDGEAVMRALGTTSDKVVAFGRSLGSLYAVELAGRFPELGGLIVESGIAELPDQWPMTRELVAAGLSAADYRREAAEQFDARAKLANYRGPVLILHTADDDLVPATHGQRLHEWAAGADKRLKLFPRGGHNSIMGVNFAEYQREVADLIGRSGIAAR